MTGNNEYDDAFAEFSGEIDENNENESEAQDNTEEQSSNNQLEEEADNNQEEENQEVNENQAYIDEIEELKRQNKELNHYKESNDGRVSALHLKVNELTDQIGSKKAGETEENPGNDSEQWNRFKEEDQYIAENIDSRIGERDQRIKDDILSEMDKRLAPIKQETEQQYVDNQLSILDEKEPEWAGIVNSDEFTQWIGSQPEKIRDMAASSDAGDYLYLIDNFKAVKSKVETEKAQVIKDKRKESLKRNETIRPRNVAHVSGAPDDFDGAFNYYARQAGDN